MMVALLAVLKAGAACLALDPKYPQERLAYMVEDSKARVLISDARNAPLFRPPRSSACRRIGDTSTKRIPTTSTSI